MFIERIQTDDVVAMAATVPMGIDLWASAKSPDRLEPAIMPEKDKKRKWGILKDLESTRR